MPIQIQDRYVNTSSTQYDNLEDFTTWFIGKRNDFFAVVNDMNLDGWDETPYVSSLNNITSETFDADTQEYIRITEWPDIDTYNNYRAAISSMDWETGDLYNLKNQTLGLEKTTTFL